MKDFFDRQESARRTTAVLLSLYVLAIAAIVLAVYSATRAIIYLNTGLETWNLAGTGSVGAFAFWDLRTFLIVAFVTLSIIIAGSLYKIKALAGGGRSIAEMLGARIVKRNTEELEEKRLINVVEEMSIASGVPVPDVYVLDKEGSINAFAAGFGMGDTVICVTKGSLMLLGRDELQGVIAHEFSHILNSDTLINIRLMGLLHGILLIGLLGGKVIRGIRHASGRMPVVGLTGGFALYTIGYIGTFFGKIIKSAVSRQREYLADASAVQFTRNPAGLAGALKKIGGLTYGSILMHPKAPEASHMYFNEGIGNSMLGMMDTHPPLEERILRIEPRFDRRYPKVQAVRLFEPPKPKLRKPSDKGFSFTGATALAMLASVGAPMKEHTDEAALLMISIPEELMAASREPYSARALIYAFLLDPKSEVRDRQIEKLKSMETHDVIDMTIRLAEHLPGLEPRSRMPLIDLSMPSLRRLSKEQYQSFRKAINMLSAEDGKISLFEYIIRHTLVRRLNSYFLKPQRKVIQVYSIRGVIRESSVVLSLLARVGQRSRQEAEAAFAHGARLLMKGGLELEFLSAKECSLQPMEKALGRLALASPVIKRKFLAVCLECLTYDKNVTVEEGELFRAVIEALDCPVPPWLATPHSQFPQAS